MIRSSPRMETTPLLERVDHVQLPVRDVRQAIAWYTEILGFKLWGGPGEDLCAFLSLSAGPLVALWQTEEGTHSQFVYQGAPKPSVFFRTASMRAAFDRLREAGAIIDKQPESWEYQGDEVMKLLFFYDPSGNYLGLIEVRPGE
jgi:catechol 2,3-dioxygenase-like lactoylglutathione lyase family enzyme